MLSGQAARHSIRNGIFRPKVHLLIGFQRKLLWFSAVCLLLIIFCTYQFSLRQSVHQEQSFAPLWIGFDDRVLRSTIELCLQRGDSYLAHDIQHQHTLAFPTYGELAAAGPCPLLDIMLSSEDRSVGLCTDAALYMHLLGARLFPKTQNLQPYQQHCNNKTARMFLEPMYEEWLSPVPGALHVFSPNFENMYASDEPLHRKMQLVLCKVQRCMELCSLYFQQLGTQATLLYTGQ